MLAFLLAFMFLFRADNCELVPVHGRVVREVRPHVYRPIASARVVIIKGPQTWLAVSDIVGNYSALVPMCGEYRITAVEIRNRFDFQIFTLPVADQDGNNIDIVAQTLRWLPNRKK